MSPSPSTRPAGELATALSGELDPDRRMVAGLLPAAHLAIDAGSDEPPGDRGAEQQMVDPQAGVAGEAFRK